MKFIFTQCTAIERTDQSPSNLPALELSRVIKLIPFKTVHTPKAAERDSPTLSHLWLMLFWIDSSLDSPHYKAVNGSAWRDTAQQK